MDMFGFKPQKKSSDDKLNEVIKNIRQGDSSLREKFIEKSKNFVLKVLSDTLGRPSTHPGSPEFDIALSAFSYSIDQYDFENRKDFILYSEQIIKEWIISYIRDASEESAPNYTTTKKNYLYYNFESKEGITLLKKRLWEFGIKLTDVARSMPKNSQAIRFSLKIAKIISGSNTLFENLTERKSIPIKDLGDAVQSEKLLIYKYRKYIIAITLILKSELKVLKSYLKNLDTNASDSNENMGVILKIVEDEALIFTIDGKFITIRHIKGKQVGEQIQFGKYRIRKSKQRINYYLVAGVSAFIILLTSFIIVYAIRNTMNKSSIAVKEPEMTNIPAVLPTNTTAIPTATVGTSPSPTTTVVPTSTPSVKPTKTTAYTSDKSTPTPRPPITSASDVPDEVRISANIYNVNAGDKYEVHMFMKSGNNGTKLILYKNEKEFKTFDLIDRTPWPQARIVEIVADETGTYTYSWNLINDFGHTSSKTITVNVLEN